MFQHFGQRLKRDLKQLVDRRLDASMLASGNVLKASRRLWFVDGLLIYFLVVGR